jgi:hypothetical protein
MSRIHLKQSSKKYGSQISFFGLIYFKHIGGPSDEGPSHYNYLCSIVSYKNLGDMGLDVAKHKR